MTHAATRGVAGGGRGGTHEPCRVSGQPTGQPNLGRVVVVVDLGRVVVVVDLGRVVAVVVVNVALASGTLLSTGSGGGRIGKEGRPRGANRADRKMVNDAARHAGLSDRDGYGDFVEQEKFAAGRRGDQNYSWAELLDLAEEFKSHGGK